MAGPNPNTTDPMQTDARPEGMVGDDFRATPPQSPDGMPPYGSEVRGAPPPPPPPGGTHSYPGSGRSYPPGVPSYPGSVPSYPGAVPSYPGAVPRDGKRRPPKPNQDQDGPGIRYYLAVVFSRWWLILLMALLGAAAGMVYIYTAKPLFRSRCRVEIVQDSRLNFTDSTPRSARFLAEQEVERRRIILRSGPMRQDVKESLQADWNSKLTPQQMDPSLHIEVVPNVPTMIDVSVDAVNPEYAQTYLSTLLEKYEAQRRTEMQKSNELANRSLKNERENVYNQLQKAQNELAKFLAEHSIQVNEAKARWDEQFLTSLIQRQNALRMEETMLQTQFTMIGKLSAGAIQELVDLSIETRRATQGQLLLNAGAGAPQTVPAPVARQQADWQIRELELARLEKEYDEKRKVYKEHHPIMIALRAKIEGVRRDLKLTAEMAMKRLEERQKAVKIQDQALETAITEWRKDLNLTVAERATYQSLNAKVANLQKLHDAVYKRMLEGSVITLDPVYQRIIEFPCKGYQVWPNKPKVMGLALALALSLGVALAFLLNHFDTTLLDIAHAEGRFGISYISGIPHWGRLIKNFSGKKNTVIVTHERNNVATEVYRTVRGTLEHLMEEQLAGAAAKLAGMPANDQKSTCYALAITSSDSGDGKSLTTLNLAVVFAWTGKRVLLVDGDLRRGALHKALGVESGEGFTELLLGGVSDWRQCTHETAHDNLHFISSGQYKQESPEQLGSPRMKSLLAEWRAAYDIVIFDTAPISRVMDTAVLARSCDGVLLVARFAKTRLAELQHLLRRLEGTHILGFCVNCIDFRRLSKSYYGYSGYYNGYREYGYGYYRYYAYYRPYTKDEKKEKKEKKKAAAKAAKTKR